MPSPLPENSPIATAHDRLAHFRRLAAALGPTVHRGVAQHFFLSLIKEDEALNAETIADCWRRATEKIRGGQLPGFLGLYLHIPFCPRLCTYCIYYRVRLSDPNDLDLYLARLRREIDYYAPLFQGIPFSTFYLGGGTPTLLSESQIDELLGHVRRSFAFGAGERCFETSPYTLTEAKARLFADYGFNRVSFGVQSFSLEVLQNVDRVLQKTEQVHRTIGLLQSFRFHVNCDLIHGLPGESLQTTLANLEHLLELGPTQVTTYKLSIYTPPLPGRTDAAPLPELAREAEPIARKHGYTIAVYPTAIMAVRSERNRRVEEIERRPDYRNYDDVTTEPRSLLGLGPTARSYIFGHLKYKSTAYPVAAPFAPGDKSILGRRLSLLDEKQFFLTQQLASDGRFSAVEYERYFRESVSVAFGEALKDLDKLGWLRRENDGYVLTVDDPTERFVAGLFFLDEQKIRAAWKDIADSPEKYSPDGPSDLVDRRNFLIRYRQACIPISLHRIRPGFGCFRQAGDFAFSIADEMAGNGKTAPPNEEKVLRLFGRFFELVVATAKPASLDALQEAILSRRDKLAAYGLAIQSPPDEEPPSR